MKPCPRLLGVLALLCMCLLSGCGKKYTVTGKVTRGGKPLEWQNEERTLLVLFAPHDRKSDPNIYRAETDSNAGTYTIKAIPSGKYLVSVQLMDPPPTIDALNFSYGLNNSPLEFEVTGNKEFNFDLPLKAPKGPKGPRPELKKEEENKTDGAAGVP